MSINTLISDPDVLFAVNHSGGKDSQAMLAGLVQKLPADRLVVVHAALGDVEWHGADEVARRDAEKYGIEFVKATPVTSFFEMVERRFERRPDVPSWPSASTRQCTSDLKRGPCNRETRRVAKARGFSKIVNCLGIRAQESAARSKKEPFRVDKRNTTSVASWWEWYPIFDLTIDQVWTRIRDAGLEPHPAYAAGNERLSCVFCIMASEADLRNGARHRPDLVEKYIALEERTGYTMHMSRKPLKTILED